MFYSIEIAPSPSLRALSARQNRYACASSRQPAEATIISCGLEYCLIEIARLHSLPARLTVSESDAGESMMRGRLSADSVEKSYIFMDGKFIFDVTSLNIFHTGRDQDLTISSERATGELT
jgi:hypothetical protein